MEAHDARRAACGCAGLPVAMRRAVGWLAPLRPLERISRHALPWRRNALRSAAICSTWRLRTAILRGSGTVAGIESPAIQRSLEGGRLPIPHIQTHDGDLLWTETVFAHLLDRRLEEGMNPSPDDMLVVHAKFQVKNRSASASVGHLWLHFGDTTDITFGYKGGRGDELGDAYPQRFEPPLGILENMWLNAPFGSFKKDVRYVVPQPQKGRVIWHAAVAPPPGMKNPAECMMEWQVPLASGEQAEFWISIPYAPVDRATGKKIAQLDAGQLWSEVRTFWNGHCRSFSRRHHHSRCLRERLPRCRSGANGRADCLPPRRQDLDV